MTAAMTNFYNTYCHNELPEKIISVFFDIHISEKYPYYINETYPN